MSSDGKIQTAVANLDYIYISTNYGDTWTAKAASTTWQSVAMSSDGKIQAAAAYGGQIYISTDYGATWTGKASSLNWNSIAISSDGKIQTAAVDSGQIYVSTDYGNNWAAKDSSRAWKSVAMSSDGKIQAAVVFNGDIYVSHADSFIPEGKLGIGTTTPSSVLDVYATTSSAILTVKQAGSGSVVDFKNATGTVFTINNAGNTLLTGNLLASTTAAYALGSSDYLWANLYTATSNLGIVASGTWQGTPVAVGYGGTGTSTAAGARTNLGLVIGTNVQAYNAGLLSIAGLVTGADQMIYTTALNTYSTTSLTAAGRALIDDAAASNQRTTLGLGTMALESNIGSTTITTLGTIGTGSWNATAIPVNKGGTGSTYFTVAGPTVTRTYTFPDANETIATLGQTQTFSGTKTFSGTTLTLSAATAILSFSSATGNKTISTGGTTHLDLAPGGNVLIGGGTGKLTVGTLDPVFNIQGLKHATYMSGMTGVKEETTGIVRLTDGEYAIDFNELEQSSDLWVFYRITDFGSNWNKLTVLLSAEGPGGAWYKKEPQNNRLIIYSQTANSVSYRFSAPRFDWQKWLNLSDDGTVDGFAIDEIINDQYSQSTGTESQVLDSSNQESGFLSEFVQKVKEALASLGLFIENGIANIHEIVTEKLTAKKARLDKIEMVDQNTGEIYCTWIENGEWIKEKGECDDTVSQESTPESSVPVIIPDEAPAEESASSTEEIVPEETPSEEIVSPETPSEETLPESQ
ncbi:MAG TPA: sialidase family protein [Candidatus Paceibacterota bacterium]|nr:sialidase family protein [Candidatus Paceibacterota bacterium]